MSPSIRYGGLVACLLLAAGALLLAAGGYRWFGRPPVAVCLLLGDPSLHPHALSNNNFDRYQQFILRFISSSGVVLLLLLDAHSFSSSSFQNEWVWHLFLEWFPFPLSALSSSSCHVILWRFARGLGSYLLVLATVGGPGALRGGRRWYYCSLTRLGGMQIRSSSHGE